jgi:uncharacterized repeat protein (TIGR04076 family)
MLYNRIRCEVVAVNTESGVCPGVAQTKQGEISIIGARTPGSPGICAQAMSAISPMKLAMSLTEKMSWENSEYFDVVCPHGFVTFRLTREI